ADVGEKIIVGGLWVQIVMFGLFAVTAVVFHVGFARRSPTARPCLPRPYTASASPYGGAPGAGRMGGSGRPFNWRRVLFVLYGLSALILVRSVFRVIEYIGGSDGYLLRHEWTLYIFDSLLMWIAMVLFWWRYPSEIRPPGKQERQRVEGSSFEELGMSDRVDMAGRR
ncbi:uncharacterized protein MKZ38_002471, partial [Zalerion maritima]